MQSNDTAEVIRRFNQAFAEHDPQLLEGLIAADCVMETIQPAPDGERYEGYETNFEFWRALAADATSRFEVEETVVMDNRANIRWRLHFGENDSLRGVSLMQVRDGKIVEALAYAKVPGQIAPLPEAEPRPHDDRGEAR